MRILSIQALVIAGWIFNTVVALASDLPSSSFSLPQWSEIQAAAPGESPYEQTRSFYERASQPASVGDFDVFGNRPVSPKDVLKCAITRPDSMIPEETNAPAAVALGVPFLNRHTVLVDHALAPWLGSSADLPGAVKNVVTQTDLVSELDSAPASMGSVLGVGIGLLQSVPLPHREAFRKSGDVIVFQEVSGGLTAGYGFCWRGQDAEVYEPDPNEQNAWRTPSLKGALTLKRAISLSSFPLALDVNDRTAPAKRETSFCYDTNRCLDQCSYEITPVHTSEKQTLPQGMRFKISLSALFSDGVMYESRMLTGNSEDGAFNLTILCSDGLYSLDPELTPELFQAVFQDYFEVKFK